MLYRFHLSLSDIDRNIYDTIDIRASLHPSESITYLLTRTLAYALSYEDRLEFSPQGLSDPDAPALQKLDLQGFFDVWIEIGNAPIKKLHKASKTSKKVIVYTYKDPQALVTEIKKHPIHRAQELEIYSLDPEFLSLLEQSLIKNNYWSILVQDQQLNVSTETQQFTTDIQRWPIT